MVDDDDAMRESLEFLLDSADFKVKSFASAHTFLEYYRPWMRGCLLLDVRMPGLSGLELQERLQARNLPIPIIIMTAYANVPMAVRAMQAGAVDFLEKPFNEEQLLARIQQAIHSDSQARSRIDRAKEVRQHWESLSPREKQVMELVVRGLLNKQIASELGLSMKTVEQHRARVMTKMQADSLADLVRMALLAELG